MAMEIVVIVEDDEILKYSLSDFISKHGYKMRLFRNGQEAMEMLMEKEKADIVITDVNLPIIDGVALWQTAQKFAADQPLPFVFIAPQEKCNNTSQKINIIEKEGLPIFHRPFDYNDLVNTIDIILHKKEAIGNRSASA